MLQGKHVTKLYKTGNIIIHILINANFVVKEGDFIFLAGFSGAGKTTFIKLLSAEETPNHGDILFQNKNINLLPEPLKLKYRQNIGVIYQDYHLISHKTVEENIIFVLEALNKTKAEIKEITENVLNIVGLYDKRNVYPEQLSGGEKRRLTIARSLAIEPIIILADEPTGDLDPYNANIIMKLLAEIAKQGTTIIMATHNIEIIKSYPNSDVWFLHNAQLHTNLETKEIEDIYTTLAKGKDKYTKSRHSINIKTEAIPQKLRNKILHIHPEMLNNIQFLTPKIFAEYYNLSYNEIKTLIKALK